MIGAFFAVNVPAVDYIFFILPCQGSKPWQGKIKKDNASIGAKEQELGIFGINNQMLCAFAS